DGAGSREPAVHPGARHRRALGAIRKLGPPDAFRIVSSSTSFTPVIPGAAASDSAPASPKNVPHRGGPANPSADALKSKFGSAVTRVDVVWGETTIIVDQSKFLEIVRWLHADASQRYDFLVDVTAVEFRDSEMPIEVVWHVRS